MSQVKLISECYIKPITSDDEKHRLPYYLGPGDVTMLSLAYMQRGLLFPKASTTTISSFLEKLKASLSLVLIHFYPLAGRLSTELYEAEHYCWIYIDCKKGPGAKLISATALDVTVSDIVFGSPDGDMPSVVRSFFDLGERPVNYDGHTRPLLSIQVTELADGVFIGCSMNHSVGDGTSLTQFINAWSEIFMKSSSSLSSNSLFDGNISNVPLFKIPFPDGYGPIIKLPYLKPEEFITRYDDAYDQRSLRKRIFHFSAASMAMLKAKVNANSAGCANRGTNLGSKQSNISSFQALSALVWRSITKARNLPLDEDTICILAVNLRPRLDPPLSDEYFGNLMGGANGTSKVGELLNYDLGWAAMLLHQAIASKDDNAARRVFLQPFIEDGPQILHPGFALSGKFVVIGGSPRFEVYQPEFGLGSAVAVRNGFSNIFDGGVTAIQGQDGGGSVDLQIYLAPEAMSRLLSDQEFMSFVSSTPLMNA